MMVPFQYSNTTKAVLNMTKTVLDSLVLKCTTKLQKEMSLTKDKLISVNEAHNNLGAWYASVVLANGGKCALFVNEFTFFNFVVPNLKPDHFQNLDQVFKNRLVSVLSEHNIHGQQRKLICPEFVPVQFAKTDSMKILGSVNDLSNHYKTWLTEMGITHNYTVEQIVHLMNRKPLASLSFLTPLEAIERNINAGPNADLSYKI